MVQPKPLLPKITKRSEYLPLQKETKLWLPALQVICQRHGFPIDSFVRLGRGTCIVFAIGKEHVIKLYPPYWVHEFNVERTLAEYVHGRLNITTPEIMVQGELEGWPYLIMSRLQGTYLCDIWDKIGNKNQLLIASQLGEILATLHNLSGRGLSSLNTNWQTFIQKRLKNVQQRYREKGLAEYWLQQISVYLARIPSLYPLNYTPTIVIGDVHQFHLLASKKLGQWVLCGLFDFDDARMGFHEYDLASAGLFMMSGRIQLLRTFLLTYGYLEAELDETLSTRLMAYTLLHGYPFLDWIQQEHGPGTFSYATLEDITHIIFDLKPL